MKRPVAILCSDLHLSHTPPVYRSAEPDWYAAQLRVLDQVDDLSHGSRGRVPVIIAGDVFDKWNPPPELINFAINNMPVFWAVPGQHDLPNHNYDEMHRSGFYTLHAAEKLCQLWPGKITPHESGINMSGFPWGFEVKPYAGPKDKSGPIKIAVIHRYCWKPGACYSSEPAYGHISAWEKPLRGYDVAIIGDNHIGFKHEFKHGCTLINNGTMMRRHSDERSYDPVVWVLHDDKSLTKVKLDTSQDKYADYGTLREAFATDKKIEQFVELLRTQKINHITFEEHLCRVLNDVSPGAAQLIREAMDLP